MENRQYGLKCRDAYKNIAIFLIFYALVSNTAAGPLSVDDAQISNDCSVTDNRCQSSKLQNFENNLEYPLDFFNESPLNDTSRRTYLRQKRQANTKCPNEGFKCKDGTCVDWDKPCDGKADCPDGSDEKFSVCRSVPCNSPYFRCAYGGCIAKNLKCNKVKDCFDNSDELHVDCRKNDPPRPKCADPFQWRCPKSEQCIARELVCDGNKDCPNGGDETIAECSSSKCINKYFKCAYGACIEKQGKCNYRNECADGSDEDPDVCGPGYTPSSTLRPTVTTPMIPVKPTTQPTGDACVIPASTRETKYSLKGTVVMNAGEIAPPFSFLNVECSSGTINTSPGIYCDDTKWSNKIPICEKQCDPLDSLTVTFSCMIPTPDGRNKVECDRKVPSGSTASPICREGHIAVGRHRLLTCKSGSWDYPMPDCSPKCGTRRPKGEIYVIAGQNATKGEFPWHVAIYTQYGQEGQGLLPKYWCGGSIIHRNLVISAAHCFYDPLTRKSFDPSLFTIAVGKMFSQFNHIEDSTEPEIQKSVVKEIRIPESYSGETTSFSNDIAIVVLETPLNFSNLILPICLDLNDVNFDSDQTSPGVIAKVAGFGLVQADVQKESDTLMTTTMPIISSKDCRENSPPEFEKYIISGKLCAGYLNGTGVCKGDSGGGLVVSTKVRNIETWYLRGIVSTAPSSDTGDHCSIKTYSTFTRAYDHKIFIENSLY